MENDDDKTVFQTEEDKKNLEKRILGENSTDESEIDTTLND